MTTTTKEYIYKSAADFLGPDRSVENEMEKRQSFRQYAEGELLRLTVEKQKAIGSFDAALESRNYKSIAHWAEEIVALDELISEHKYFFEGNSKRYIELLDRKDELKEMLAKELA